MFNIKIYEETKSKLLSGLTTTNYHPKMSDSKKIVSVELIEKVAEAPAASFNQQEELCRVIKTVGDNLIKAVEDLNTQIKNSQIPQIYFTKDLCEIYKVSESTIYKNRKSGLLDYCSDGQKIWFTQEHIDDFNRRTDSRFKEELRRAE